MKQIQWYPGHMDKAIRELDKLTKRVNLFFFILDARAPISTIPSNLEELFSNKQIIALVTKTDLAGDATMFRHELLDRGFKDVIFTNSKQNVEKQILASLKGFKSKSLILKFAIVGIPNVGKSTIINKLTNKKSAKTEDRAGITRNNRWYQVENYWFLDTPGILPPKLKDLDTATKVAAVGCIKLEVLPIKDVALNLAEIIMTKFNIDILKGRIFNSIDDYKKVVHDFQKQKFGKLVLDNL